MRRVLWIAALSALTCLGLADTAMGRGCGRGCGGHHRGHCGGGGCGGYYGGCGGCGGGYYGGLCAVPGTGASVALGDAPARLFVSLPADATLTIDNTPTVSTSAQRVFESPTLPQGKTFQYTLKATILRDGKPTTVTKVVDVRAGEDTQVKFEIPATSAAAD
jgi:uncharacterized protein (TIGR03000 family)